jgi:hypothetical protein
MSNLAVLLRRAANTARCWINQMQSPAGQALHSLEHVTISGCVFDFAFTLHSEAGLRADVEKRMDRHSL